MKKYIITMLGLLVMLSCGQKPRSSSLVDNDDEDDDDERVELKLKNYTFSQQEGMAHCALTVAYPTKGDRKLVNAIRTYIAEQADLESDEVELTDGQGVTDYYGQQLMDQLRQLALDYEGDDYVTEVYHNWHFKKIFEDDDCVTFMGESSIYEGGIHGIEYEHGVTFFEESGQRFTADMLKATDSPRFQQLLRDGLRQFFSTEGHPLTDEELAEELIAVEDIHNIPMPQAQPYITAEGVTFVYQPYEISYYGAGLPKVHIPLRQMKPFLSRKAQRLLDMDE